jgi:hypothetical protein
VTWTWRYEDAQGQRVSEPPVVESFSTKGDAESWLGENWRELNEAGVQRVVLLEDDRAEYTMPLTPAEG